MPALHNLDHERELWDTFASNTANTVNEDEPVLCWTQYAGHGPGPEILGSPESALEIGCGTGRAAAFLAQRGVEVTGVDLSPVAVEQTSRRWGPLGVKFVCADVLEFLAETPATYDAVYSNFGAAWFADPEKLFPLVERRLNPDGVFVFSQPPAIPGAYGPQGMYKGGFAGKAMFTYRYSFPPEEWHQILKTAGFCEIYVQVLEAPTVGHIDTLIVQARKGTSSREVGRG